MRRKIKSTTNQPRPITTPATQFNAAKACMNTGHAFMQSDNLEDLQAAVESYTQAIQLLNPIADNLSYANSLGAAYMNRGQLHHQIEGPSNPDAALTDFENAAGILVLHLNESTPWIHRNYSGTLVNHANLLLDLNRPIEAEQLATLALHSIRDQETLDPTDTQLSLLARRTLCDAIGQRLPAILAHKQPKLATEASNHADAALALIRSLRQPNQPEPYFEISLRLYHYGASLYALHQPHFLEEFLTEHIATLSDPRLQASFQLTAQESIQTAVDTLAKKLTDPTTDIEIQETIKAQAESLQRLHQTM